MLLKNLLAHVKDCVAPAGDCEITGICVDSRQCKPGDLFMAVPGTAVDGRSFIAQAVAKGAHALLVPSDTDPATLPSTLMAAFAPDMRRAVSQVACAFYPGSPSLIAAITGTSGKTSSVQFTRELWQLAGFKSASIGTLGLVTSRETTYGSLTTPDPITLHKLMDQTARAGVSHMAMEASSHGIALGRLDDVKINIGAFTNLSRDHLDYHQTMDDYFDAKRQLFLRVLRQGSLAVLNADVPEFETLFHDCSDRKHSIISFGEKGRDIRLIKAVPVSSGQALRLDVLGRMYDLVLPVVGAFQVWNSMTALGIAIGSGVGPDLATGLLQRLSGVPGRLEHIGTSARGGSVFVDYAHKPAALEHVLHGLRPHVAAHPGARLHVVFGCGGNRDKGKRPLMGKIAQDLADCVIVTDDNPRNEQAAVIRSEILAGCVAGPNLREIGDRADAIAEGIKALGPHDVLVIAGKGHESGQIVGDQVLPFNDADVARAALQQGL